MFNNKFFPAILAISCFLCAMFALENAADADSMAVIQKHIEKVKRENPVKYNDMVEKAGGNITTCLSCHKELIINNSPKSPPNK